MTIAASPSVRSYAGRKGVDLGDLAERTGRQHLAKEDVDSFLENGGGAPAGARPPSGEPGPARYWDVDHSAFGPVEEEELPRFARIAADNLSAANALIPQVTHNDRADIGAVEAFRASLKEEALARGVKLTTLAFHVKILSRCLTEFPRFNASLSADGRSLIRKQFVHIGIAVDTPHGLMVPVIRDVAGKGLFALAGEIADLAARAKARKIRPDEMGGASMSLSNLGGIGGTSFTPIVNPPEVAILGLTRTEMQPVWDGEGFVPRPMVPISLSYDHRVINGAEAARFTARYAELTGDPRRLLI
ncbi:2-oxo acid dehydrogenase subunit E2 [Aurantimonas sp. VKM B-3413]|uniref:2-oxo acid dehydrogenase subunit E2 n=1 Tax=Aurantimonas sp. VKM B-3413 TaxID=2779401 RepID=UPI001E3ADF3C|nr:2-oxo acid dehydrogenase subunit E2 [Aurantimonas sp. VKM B-3413]MCB8839953.1 2-oxo acid dehydrogenase subunit E2 [Aurantimonas sp. VKM B-3413]